MAKDKEVSTSVVEKGKEYSITSPLYLHPSEGPGTLITTVQLKGDNYEDWAKHVRNALRTKRKIGFVDGTFQKPTDTTDLEQWVVVNSMIVAWIMNMIEPTVRMNISLVDKASILWEDLKLHFSVGNGPRIHELKADLANCKQQGDSVMAYYGRLKKMWDELAVYEPLLSCSCGELATKLEEARDNEHTHQFLMGLDDVIFGGIRSTLTNMEPLLKLSQVYQRVVRDERQQNITRSKEDRGEVVGFSAQTGNKSTCTHCGKYGHDVSDCYQIKGYPEHWGERGRTSGYRGGRGRYGRGGGALGSNSGRGRGQSSARSNVVQVEAHSAQVQQVANSATTTRRDGGYDRASLPQLNDDQWTALIGFLNQQKTAETGTKLSGKTELIIDSGASHHMTSNMAFLSDVTDIAPCSNRLPDGDRALAQK
ncbi:uncharacterized protein LOC112087504 [Eutrema salsugineum]|uniref:uncharacterized protein LOC112087504 n=1 Tax=Eutrema salsugineum TaxID=72664 RepID=UPI000CECF5D2|nr:uncharacterized protein LOC112087504 [Eutrema salsugineum]